MNPDWQAATPLSNHPAISVASFWLPHYSTASTWMEHAPFGFWLMDALRPNRVVEIGTYNGFSLLTFCQAGKALGIECACYGVGQWNNEEGASLKSDEVYRQLAGLIERDYSSMAELRNVSSIDAALYFTDSSVDLLHLTGQKNYEELLNVCQRWLPKISSSGIVLVHDINLHDDRSGAWRLWTELKDSYPSFEFIHGKGLGVLAVGSDIVPPIAALMQAPHNKINLVRATYGRLGRSITTNHLADSKVNAAVEAEARTTAILKRREHELALKVVQHKELESLKRTETKLQAEIIDAMKQHSAATDVIRELKVTVSRLEERMALRDSELAKQRMATESESQSRYALLTSLSMAASSSTGARIHPLTLFVARYSKSHPKRVRILWAALRGSRLLLTLQWKTLARAIAARLR